MDATHWLRTRPETAGRAVGYFGASTGAAAALVAAAEPETGAAAVVCRGGRPDLAGAALGRVRAPTLLVVGGRDPEVLELNRAAQRQLWGESELTVVPGATHLFEEPGALDRVAELAAAWFLQHLPAGGRAARRTGFVGREANCLDWPGGRAHASAGPPGHVPSPPGRLTRPRASPPRRRAHPRRSPHRRSLRRSPRP